MLLRDLTIRHLKRIETLPLSFRKADGSPREWTVLIGRNGTAKTTILQAIALAAAGEFRANSLIEDIRESLPDKRVPGAIAEIEANFTFGPFGQRYDDGHPMLDAARHPLLCAPDYRLWLRSRLRIRANAAVEGSSKYVDAVDLGPEGKGDPEMDPLMVAREKNLPLWFVAGYGVDRHLPQTKQAPVPPPRPSIDRIRPLFERWDQPFQGHRTRQRADLVTC